MSYVEGLSMTTEILEQKLGHATPTPADVREALGEDFPEEEFQDVARFWLQDYGVRATWKPAVEAVAGGR